MFSFLFLIIKKCFKGKKEDWIAVNFWQFVLPYIFTERRLRNCANKLDWSLILHFLRLNVISTQAKMNSLYEASDLEHKTLLLMSIELFQDTKKNIKYPSLVLIDKDIEEIHKIDSKIRYESPEERLLKAFNW